MTDRSAKHNFSPRRSGISVLAGLIVLGATLLLAVALGQRERHHLSHMTRMVARGVRADIEADLETRFLDPMRYADLWNIPPKTTREAWQAKARIYLREHPEFIAVQWAGTDQTRWSVPESWAAATEAESLKELQAASHEITRDERAGKRVPVFAPLPITVNKLRVRRVLVPIYQAGELQGVGAALFPEQATFKDLLDDVSGLGYAITVSEHGEESYRLPGVSDRFSEEWGVDTQVKSAGMEWAVRVWPTPTLISEMQTHLPQFVFGMGLVLSLLVALTTQFAQSLKMENELRSDAENQLRALVESSPAAIVTVDSGGKVLLANDAARRMFCPGEASLVGRTIGAYLPPLFAAVRTDAAQVFRTSLQCKAQRSNGEAFMAGVWFSRYRASSGQHLAAIVVDLSEELRNWEELSFDHLLKGTRFLMSAMSHEIRNLCGAALVIHRNLRRVTGLEGNEDFHALGTLIQGLERISALELSPATEPSGEAVDLAAVLDDLQALVESMCRESNIAVGFQRDGEMPLVLADRYGLLQVFLNLVKNSERAMANSEMKMLRVSAAREADSVIVRFEDSGSGVEHPENLFRPFQQGAQSSGLGLFVSRAILKSYGAEITYEPRPQGCCFAVTLAPAPPAEAAMHA